MARACNVQVVPGVRSGTSTLRELTLSTVCAAPVPV
jgi:hypothetical protein